MIITVTLNPAVDKTVELDELVPGETNRVSGVRTDPGGKGIDVSRVLRTLGTSSLAMGFVAGSMGRFVEASLNEAGILDDFIHTQGQTRTNVAIVERNKSITTLLSEAGPETDPQCFKLLKSKLAGRLDSKGNWVVCSGSIPPPLTHDAYAQLIELTEGHGGFAVLDADGEALSLGVAAKPYLIKPNRFELGHLVGRTLSTFEDVLAAAQEVQRGGVQYVIASMGRRGAIGVTHDQAWKATPPAVKVQSTVGAGDSLLAGVIHSFSRGHSLQEGLRLGTACGAATALTAGTQLCYREDIDRLLPEVVVERIY
ncbi:MAG: 1-phosphofructokinase [Chloroflexi bacterium]|nr:1-phosphofructokinase [Chloroflexota bacterium]